jgi:serralysin
LYGANRNFHSGNDTYSFTQGQSYFQTLWDGGGSDTIVWNASTESTRIDLRAGQFSDLGQSLLYTLGNGTQRIDADTVAIAYGVTIENADGGGADDTLIGNDAHNMLRGGDGNDTLTGGAAGHADGGSGIDTAVFNGARASYTLGGTASAP